MKVFLYIFSSMLLFFTCLPMVKHEYWVFRIFDYPRIQKLVGSITCIVLMFFYFSFSTTIHLIFFGAICLNAMYLIFLIYPFTKFGKLQVLRITNEKPDQSFSIMIANVYQQNKNYQGCLHEIEKANPDIVLLLETDLLWENNTKSLELIYSNHIRFPLENTYGMLLYSKLTLENGTVRFMVDSDVPSIHTKLVLPNGQKIQLYAVHPTPPVPTENPRSTERDKELLLVADLAHASIDPVVVIGDLNDVAWSYTTSLFLKMSGLLDPRRGRGFFNTFHAHYPFLRFPLDHAFISTDLKLKTLKRLDNFDSDHFPIFISLQYDPNSKQQENQLTPNEDDLAVATEKKAKD